MNIQVRNSVPAEEASAALSGFRSLFRCADGGEQYLSPDKRLKLELHETREMPFGPRLFAAAITGERGEKTKLRGGPFLSGGCFGVGFDHWSGNPWSPKSDSLVLAQIDGSGHSSLSLFHPFDSRAEIIGKDAIHHMWSSNGTYYLYRRDHAYHLIQRERMQAVGSVPIDNNVQHVVFAGDDRLLLLGNNCQLIDAASLQLISETELPKPVTTRDYCFVDDFSGFAFVGFDFSIRGHVASDRWISLSVT